MRLSPFQKNVLFVFILLIVSAGGTLGALCGYNAWTAHRAAVRLADARARVERVMSLNLCAHFSDGEQARLDRVNTDPYETKKVLLAIHKERYETWATNLRNAQDRAVHYRIAQANLYYANYRAEILEALQDAERARQEMEGFSNAVKWITDHDPSAPLEEVKEKKTPGSKV